MATYSIKDLEKLTGIKAHTLRIWEQRYGIIKPHRTTTNIRYYDDEQLKYLLNVSLLVENGQKISKVSKLPKEDLNKKILGLYEHDNEHASVPNLSIGAQINALVLAMIELSEEKFEKVFSNNLMRKGFDKTITEVIYPFLEKVGVMWTINEINPAQEHFISNLIRQKLIVAIDTLEIPQNPKYQFLLYLPEGELHEVGLLLSHYLIKSNGAKVTYLGQNVPFRDVKEVVHTCNPDYLLTFFTSPMKEGQLQQYLNKLATTFSDKQILIAGAKSQTDLIIPQNLKQLSSPEDLLTYL